MASSDGPYLSLNPKYMNEAALAAEPSGAVLEEMKKLDPKFANAWTIWEQLKPDKNTSTDYADVMKQTVSFSTVKEFWGCWNHIPQPSELLANKKWIREDRRGGSGTVVDSIMVFRKGVKPAWEDPQNANGGHFQFMLKSTMSAALVDELWNNLVLGMIAGAIEPAEMLSGVRLVDRLESKKPLLRVELWFNELDEETLAGGQGKAYDLKCSFERCMRLGLDGKEKQVTWGRTEIKPHKDK